MENVNFSIGTDPELFCSLDDNLIAVQNCGITGTKKDPQPLSNGGNAQRDNVAIEFGVPPTYNKEDFVNVIGLTLRDLQKAVPENVRLLPIPSAYFPEDQLTSEEAKQFGCDPDNNAWTLKENKPPACAAEQTLRSCGGHIHLLFAALDNSMNKAIMIRIMDMIHGQIATYLDNSPEAIVRRQLYGKAGCYRETEYGGVEYRTLSNFWIKSPLLVELMYELTADAIRVFKNNQYMELMEAEGGGQLIQQTITEGMVDKAEHNMRNVLPKYLSDESKRLLDKAITAVGFNFEKEWGLAS